MRRRLASSKSVFASISEDIESLEVNQRRITEAIREKKEEIKPLWEELRDLQRELKAIDLELASLYQQNKILQQERETAMQLKQYDPGFSYKKSFSNRSRRLANSGVIKWNRDEIKKLKADLKAFEAFILRKQQEKNKIIDQIGDLVAKKNEVREELKKCYMKLDEIGNSQNSDSQQRFSMQSKKSNQLRFK